MVVTVSDIAGRIFPTPPALRYVVLRHEGIDEPHFDVMFETTSGSKLVTWRSPRWPIESETKLTKLGTEAPAPERLPPNTMPRLNSGANPDAGAPTWTFLSLTRYQLAHVDNWVNGNFDADWPGSPPAPVPFDQIPVARQAWALCEAALEACVGGSFFPWIVMITVADEVAPWLSTIV